MTLQQTIDHLEALAYQRGAEMRVTVQHKRWGNVLIIEWDNVFGLNQGAVADMPRECFMDFRINDGPFVMAHVYDPHRMAWALEEGLTDVQASDEGCRTVLSLDDVIRFLTGAPYSYTREKVLTTDVN